MPLSMHAFGQTGGDASRAACRENAVPLLPAYVTRTPAGSAEWKSSVLVVKHWGQANRPQKGDFTSQRTRRQPPGMCTGRLPTIVEDVRGPHPLLAASTGSRVTGPGNAPPN